MPKYTLLILSISTPLILGVYRNNQLIETIKSEQKISEILLDLIVQVMKKYPLSLIIYTRGPGSYMSIKLSYIILKTIELVKDIPFRGCSAFSLNGGEPIRAIGKLYFVKNGDEIATKKFEKCVEQVFELPQSIDSLALDTLSTPNYILPAV